MTGRGSNAESDNVGNFVRLADIVKTQTKASNLTPVLVYLQETRKFKSNTTS